MIHPDRETASRRLVQASGSAHLWRVEDVQLRHLGKNGLALDAEGPEESCVGKALVDFPEQPP
jgi:hypothetical protein